MFEKNKFKFHREHATPEAIRSGLHYPILLYILDVDGAVLPMSSLPGTANTLTKNQLLLFFFLSQKSANSASIKTRRKKWWLQFLVNTTAIPGSDIKSNEEL